MPSVGAVVFTLREMPHIERCLDSLRWADTVDICPLGERPASASWQRNATDWVLYLWGQERVDAELPDAIRETLASGTAGAATQYRLRVRSRLLDSWLEASAWGPVPSPRLRRGGQDRLPWGWSPETFDPADGPVLPGWISDHSFEEISSGVDQLNALSSALARSAAAVPDGPLDLIRVPGQVLCRLLFRQRLWFSGIPGIGLSVIASYSCVATSMKAWELKAPRPNAENWAESGDKSPVPRRTQRVEC